MADLFSLMISQFLPYAVVLLMILSLFAYFLKSKENAQKQTAPALTVSETLEEIVKKAYKELEAITVELLLRDEETGQHTSSIVLGLPVIGEGSLLEEDLKFGSLSLGVLRIRLSRTPSDTDRKFLKSLGREALLFLVEAEYTKELLKLKRHQEGSVRAKTGFLASLSHEIRGPLGIMLNAVELVASGMCGPVTKDQKETLDMVKGNGKHLLTLINDVLDFAKVESGKLTAHPSVIDVSELLDDLVNVIRVQAQVKRHELIFTPPSDLLHIHVDPRHMRQMLINLLTNAVKYTQEQGKISVFTETKDGKVSIHVKDSGVGIPERERDKVFQAFERLDNEYAKSQGGTGLGMPLTKKLAELNGGTIDFISTSGIGSDFFLTFPLSTETIVDEVTEGEVKEVKGAGRTLLVVTQKDAAFKVITRYLARLGFRLAYASTKEELSEIMMTMPISGLLVDDIILEGDGKSLIQTVRHSGRGARIPIIMVSNRAFAFEVEDSLRLGVDRCLHQPIELDEIARVVDAATNRRSGEVGKIVGRL